jgi:hypothetical protein
MNEADLIRMLDGYMESGGSYFKAAESGIMTDISSGKSGGQRTSASVFTAGESNICPTCADIPNISVTPDNE